MAAEGVHEEGESLVGKEFAGDGRIDAEHARQTEGERCRAADEAELPAVVGLEGYRGAPHAVVQRMVGQISYVSVCGEHTYQLQVFASVLGIAEEFRVFIISSLYHVGTVE